MHDLPAMYNHFLDVLRDATEQYFDDSGNHNYYPNPPKLSDIEVVALACAAEALEIDSENLLFSKLNSYPDLLLQRCTRQRFNARRRNLRSVIDHCLRLVSGWIEDPIEALLTDSMPIPTASVKRETRSKACRRPELDAQCADKTLHPSSGHYFLGFKIHIITTVSGVYVDHVLRPASEHDAKVFAELAEAAADNVLPDDLKKRLDARLMIADKGYFGKQLSLDFTKEFNGILNAFCRSNSKNWEPINPLVKRARRYIETVFSQLCDEMRMKTNRAKRFSGLETRISTKLLVRTLKQWVNYHTGKPINQTKHWLA